MFRLGLLAVLLLFMTFIMSAQNGAGINGKVLDPTGTPTAGVAITLTNLATHTVSQTTSDSDGNYSIKGLAPGNYSMRASKTGFELYERTLSVQSGQSLAAGINLSLSAVQQTVVVNGGSQPGATSAALAKATSSNPTRRLRVIDRTPDGHARTRRRRRAGHRPRSRRARHRLRQHRRDEVHHLLNGINQGWGGYGGYTGGASLGITFDGIPIVDPATGLWQSATVPQMQIIQDTVITYGPGDPLQSLVHQRRRARSSSLRFSPAISFTGT